MIPSLSGGKFIRLDSRVKIVFDGNSIVEGYYATDPSLSAVGFVEQYCGGALVVNMGVSGHSWDQMQSHATDDEYDESKTNILLVMEHVNTLYDGYTVAQTIDAMRSYASAKLLANPGWKIMLGTCIPHQWFDGEELDSCNQYMRDNWREMGCAGVAESRVDGFPWKMPGYTTQDYDNIGQYYLETSPNMVHPNNSGHRVLGRLWLSALKHIPVVR